MKKERTSPIESSDYGTVLERQMSLDKKTLSDLLNIGVVVTIFCAIADFTKLFVMWDKVQTENVTFVIMCALIAAIALDVPMLIVGNYIKSYRQGLVSKKERNMVVIIAVVCFLLAFIPSIIFSIVTKDATFQAVSTSSNSNIVGYVNEVSNVKNNETSVLVAAIYAGMLPLLTSLVSLLVGYYTYNPLKEKLNKIKKARIKANDHLMYLNRAMAEEESLIKRQSLLAGHEKDMAVQFVEECYSQEAIRIQAFLEALEEKCDPDGISEISEYAKQVIKKHEFNDNMYEETLKALKTEDRTIDFD